jgi:hypothetical protein
MNVDLSDTYWDRLSGYATELRVDARWVLRKYDDEKSYGSLRIASHPDLKPGYLRAIFTTLTNIEKKSKSAKLRALEDYQMDELDLEIYNVDNDITTNTEQYEAPHKELNEMFGVDIFAKN